ncbi:MAG TPA: 5-methyltetrahydropteroyltriglutamate--homocysteine S-methyltransferase [Bacillus sp. (in: firmicutes)]|uniref:5-methyltetrahydropteroyltriglutamate-- homocysteine S-methyltransferase n=1 Tax=Bacillus litorisediminis TaxID=2922713 RepID=UPI001FAEE310|nr:5-methyltetrahydropteroyltriglutamate--homocysteine S-methyltransferase [Bacillus litorisediminis]HWO74447.1 5-methyltetrahydropteroyltriglutamate--homocysteine S-methyltransferase [Bacillus sp. (in: firmicutes)]
MTETKTVKAPFKADHVGSFLRPERIKQARLQKEKGEISAKQLREIENEEIIKLVEKQKAAGLHSITDGEFRRAYWHFDFLENLVGVEGYEAEKGIQFHGAVTKAHSIRVVGKIDFDGHPMLEDYKFLHSIVGDQHVAKMTIPSPNMLFYRGNIDKEIYPNEELLLADITKAYKKAIQAFYDAGCRYLQLDDTSWAVFLSEQGKQMIRERGQEPEHLKQLFAKAINESIESRPEDMLITMHICRGNFRSTYSATGPYEGAAETIFGELKVDGLFLEYDDDRSGGFEPLRYVKRDDLHIVLGLITSKFAELESVENIKKRIEEASQYVPKSQLCLSPQCGFASTEEGNILTEEEQWAKIRHVIEIAREVW